MYPITNAFKNALAAGAQLRERLLVETAFETFTLDEAGIMQSTLSISEGVTNGTTFHIGGVVIGNMSVTLLNNDGRYDDVQLNGATLRPSVGLEIAPGSMEWVPMGVFTVDSVSRLIDAIRLTAVDNMALLEQSLTSVPITFPCTALVLLSACCQYCAVPLATTSFLHSDYVIAAAPDGDMSCRDVASCVAEIAGCWARFNRIGQLELGWFDNPAPIQEVTLDGNADDADGGDFTRWNNKTYDGGVFVQATPVMTADEISRMKFTQDDSPITITGISLETDEGILLAGSDRYAIAITDNPLIQDNAATVLSEIWQKLKDFTFLPMTLEWGGNPATQAGDMIEVADRLGNKYRTILTESKYRFHDRCVATAIGATQLAAGYRSRSDKKISRLVAKVAKKQVQINALNQAILNATSLIAGALGGYAIKGEGDYDGNFFIADNPDITQAVKVWRWNLGGFGYSENGVAGPYATAITADGSIVANIITASMIRTGLLQSLNGASWIDMDTGALSMGNGALKWDAVNGFEAISSNKLVSPNTPNNYVLLGKGPNTEDGYGMFLVDSMADDGGAICRIYGTQVSDYGARYTHILLGAGTIGGGVISARELMLEADDGSSSAAIVVTPDGVEFQEDGLPIGYDGTIPTGKRPVFKKGICTGYTT